MDNSFSQQGSDIQRQPGVLLASLQFFDGILNWLAGLIQLTEEEQTEAGIQLGDQHYE